MTYISPMQIEVPAADPFRIEGPAVISFSGGRTSGYMLHRILLAHGGTLPNDVLVCFANTGREMPATLEFVRDCGATWNTHINWLEYRYRPGHDGGRGAHDFVVVSHNEASRDGEPFEDVIVARRGLLPNPTMRYCTAELKIRTMERFIKVQTGWKKWTQVVGLRADEPGRVFRATDEARQKKQNAAGWVMCPLHEAGVTEADVGAFWREQPFDLRVAGKWEGNCDGCFLKSRSSISRMISDHPDRMAWWTTQEEVAVARGVARDPAMARFRMDRSYAEMTDVVKRQGVLPYDVFEPEASCTEWACTD